MRGLPPLPLDVVHLEQDYEIASHSVSIGFWLFNPSNNGAGLAQLADITDAWFVTCLPTLYGLQHDGTIAGTCRAALPGLAIVDGAPPGHGAWAGGQADNVALGIHWATGEGGARRGPITFVPGVPDLFITDNWMLSAIAFGNLIAAARDLYNALNALPAPDGTFQVVGTLHRQRAGAPLAASEFVPYVGAIPTPKVVTIRRRIPARRAVSPV